MISALEVELRARPTGMSSWMMLSRPSGQHWHPIASAMLDQLLRRRRVDRPVASTNSITCMAPTRARRRKTHSALRSTPAYLQMYPRRIHDLRTTVIAASSNHQESSQ
jgi:hypothetical protein